jgi:hypothetical protein
MNMLVVSDPPHGDVEVEAAAAVLGLAPEHTRLKIRFRAPEVMALGDGSRATDVAASLRAAGVSTRIRDGELLTQVPWPTLVSRVDLGLTGLRAALGDRFVEVAYDDPVLAVYCQPPADFAPPPNAVAPGPSVVTGPAAAEAIEWVPHLDLYFERDGALGRLSVAGEGLASAVDACHQRFTSLVLDTRLVGVRPRRRFVAGDQGFNPDQRKRYAFGTLLLRHALESISPELRDLTHYELGSRLAYILDSGGQD